MQAIQDRQERQRKKNSRSLKKKHLTEEQHKALLNLAKQDLTNGPLLLMSILATTGIRAEELSHLVVADLDLVEGALHIYAAKDSNDRTLYLPPWLCQAVIAHPHIASDTSKPLFALLQTQYSRYLSNARHRHNAKQLLREYWRQLRPTLKASDISLHGLRHSVAIRMLEKTKDITKVQAVLGHKSINNTMFYLEYVNSLQASKDLLGLFVE